MWRIHQAHTYLQRASLTFALLRTVHASRVAALKSDRRWEKRAQDLRTIKYISPLLRYYGRARFIGGRKEKALQYFRVFPHGRFYRSQSIVHARTEMPPLFRSYVHTHTHICARVPGRKKVRDILPAVLAKLDFCLRFVMRRGIATCSLYETLAVAAWTFKSCNSGI